MRFDLLARRIAAPALGVALAVTVAACSSSSSTPAAGSGSSSPASTTVPASSSVPTSSGSGSGGSSSTGSSAAVGTITANWEAFFNGKTSAAKKISLLQNGSKYATAIEALAGSSLATSAGAKVTAVAVNASSTSATVSYSITLSGAVALPGQSGTAVYTDGVWKVGDVSFCDLLKLENGGKAPSVCSG